MKQVRGQFGIGHQKPLTTRNAEILRQSHAGIPAREIASRFGLTLDRIYQIVRKANR